VRSKDTRLDLPRKVHSWERRYTTRLPSIYSSTKPSYYIILFITDDVNIRLLHLIAEDLELNHVSEGFGADRHLVISKRDLPGYDEIYQKMIDSWMNEEHPIDNNASQSSAPTPTTTTTTTPAPTSISTSSTSASTTTPAASSISNMNVAVSPSPILSSTISSGRAPVFGRPRLMGHSSRAAAALRSAALANASTTTATLTFSSSSSRNNHPASMSLPGAIDHPTVVLIPAATPTARLLAQATADAVADALIAQSQAPPLNEPPVSSSHQVGDRGGRGGSRGGGRGGIGERGRGGRGGLWAQLSSQSASTSQQMSDDDMSYSSVESTHGNDNTTNVTTTSEIGISRPYNVRVGHRGMTSSSAMSSLSSSTSSSSSLRGEPQGSSSSNNNGEISAWQARHPTFLTVLSGGLPHSPIMPHDLVRQASSLKHVPTPATTPNISSLVSSSLPPSSPSTAPPLGSSSSFSMSSSPVLSSLAAPTMRRSPSSSSSSGGGGSTTPVPTPSPTTVRTAPGNQYRLLLFAATLVMVSMAQLKCDTCGL
jgi:hypothetical protein